MSSLDGEATDTSIKSAETRLSWVPLVLTEEKLGYLWEHIREFPQVFDDFSKGNKGLFIERLLDPRNIFVEIGEGLGLAAGFGVKPGLDMVLHLVMFDKRLRGREGTFLEIISHFFAKLQLRRVTAMITDDSPMTIRLLQRLGFVHEGTMRRSVLRGGKYLNMCIYGMLKEELDAKVTSFAAGSTAVKPSGDVQDSVSLGDDSAGSASAM